MGQASSLHRQDAYATSHNLFRIAIDLERVAEILEKYADSRIDFVDASVMAVAERYGSKTILTLGRVCKLDILEI